MAENEKPHEADGPRQPSSTPARRAYARPALIEYGSVAKLTQGTMTFGSDNPAAGFKMAGR